MVASELRVMLRYRLSDGSVKVSDVAILDRQRIPWNARVYGVVPAEEGRASPVDGVNKERVAGCLRHSHVEPRIDGSPRSDAPGALVGNRDDAADRLLSLIHISEPTRRTPISYAVFC